MAKSKSKAKNLFTKIMHFFRSLSGKFFSTTHGEREESISPDNSPSSSGGFPATRGHGASRHHYAYQHKTPHKAIHSKKNQRSTPAGKAGLTGRTRRRLGKRVRAIPTNIKRLYQYIKYRFFGGKKRAHIKQEAEKIKKQLSNTTDTTLSEKQAKQFVKNVEKATTAERTAELAKFCEEADAILKENILDIRHITTIDELRGSDFYKKVLGPNVIKRLEKRFKQDTPRKQMRSHVLKSILQKNDYLTKLESVAREIIRGDPSLLAGVSTKEQLYASEIFKEILRFVDERYHLSNQQEAIDKIFDQAFDVKVLLSVLNRIANEQPDKAVIAEKIRRQALAPRIAQLKEQGLDGEAIDKALNLGVYFIQPPSHEPANNHAEAIDKSLPTKEPPEIVSSDDTSPLDELDAFTQALMNEQAADEKVKLGHSDTLGADSDKLNDELNELDAIAEEMHTQQQEKVETDEPVSINDALADLETFAGEMDAQQEKVKTDQPDSTNVELADSDDNTESKKVIKEMDSLMGELDKFFVETQVKDKTLQEHFDELDSALKDALEKREANSSAKANEVGPAQPQPNFKSASDLGQTRQLQKENKEKTNTDLQSTKLPSVRQLQKNKADKPIDKEEERLLRAFDKKRGGSKKRQHYDKPHLTGFNKPVAGSRKGKS